MVLITKVEPWTITRMSERSVPSRSIPSKKRTSKSLFVNVVRSVQSRGYETEKTLPDRSRR